MKKYTLISKGLLGTTSLVSILGFGAIANAAQLTPVSLELAIIIDASESISQESFDHQLIALDNIFNDPNFYNDFISPLKDHPTLNIDNPSLAVGIFQFGGTDSRITDLRAGTPIFEPIVDWTVFNEQRQSGIGSLDPSNISKVGGLTPIGDLLAIMTDELSNNDYDGHQVINLSSDGFDTFSQKSLPVATREAFITDVTFNALVIPSLGEQRERTISGTDEVPYNIKVLQSIVDRYEYLPPEDKKKNLAGNPAFVMVDYATGDKTIEEAFRLKLGLETIGRAPISRPDVDPNGSGGDPNGPGIDPNGSGGDPNGPGIDPNGSGGDPNGPGIDPNGPGTGETGNPAAQHIPEPSSLFALLSVSLLGLLRQKKKA